MAQINLLIKFYASEHRLRREINLHNLPRIGETIDLKSILESSSDKVQYEARLLTVLSVSHPISESAYVHIPTILCDGTKLSKESIEFFKSDGRWKTVDNLRN